MDFSTKKFIIGENEIIHEGTVEQMVESDVTLPDYCPDIIKILKCKIEPQITSTTVTGDRVTIDGKAQIRLIYADEENCIKCYEQSYPFSKYFEDASISENVTAIINSKVEYVNCRAVSPRKADVRANIAFMFKIIRKNKHEVICDAVGSGIQLRKENCEIADFKNIAEKCFSVGEVLELPSSLPAAIQIIRENAVVILGEVKIINSKVLFKAELSISILYSDENNSINNFKKSIPLTQVIELDGIEDDANAEVQLEVACLEVQMKSDANSEMRLFDVNSRIQSVVKVTSDKSFYGISDAYSTQCEVDIKRKPIKIFKRTGSVNDTALTKVNLDFSTTGITQIIDTWCTNTKSKTSFADSSLVVCGTTTVCLIYKDRDSNASYAEREINFEYKKSVDGTENASFTPNLKILDLNTVVVGDNTAEFKAEYSVSGEIYKTEMKNLITELMPIEEKAKNKSSSAITVYFPDVNENVWDIARKFNSTVEKISEENSLTEEIITKRCMLMITAV